MRTRHVVLIVGLLAIGASYAPAQRDKTRQQLIQLRKTLASLDWHDVDFAALSPVERCRTLLLLNNALDELGSAALAESDLLGTFLEQQKLEDEYKANPPTTTAPVARNYDDARKIAAALLKGPMSGSSYSTDLADVDERGLQAYQKMYDTTCRGKWDEFASSSQDARSMIAFLRTKGKVGDYMSWAQAETERRQKEHDEEMAQRRTATRNREDEQRAEQQARVAEAEKERKERAESRQAQEAIYAAEQPQSDSQGATVVVQGDDDWYPGWYYGVLSNVERRPYHRDRTYQAAARERVAQRRSGGGGGHRR